MAKTTRAIGVTLGFVVKQAGSYQDNGVGFGPIPFVSLELDFHENKTRHSLNQNFPLYSRVRIKVTRSREIDLADVNLETSCLMDAELRDRAQTIRERILQLGDSL
jgi:hypothetical protein